MYYKDQLPLKIKDIFTENAPVNPYTTRGGKFWNDILRNIDSNNNNLCNTATSKFVFGGYF